MLSKRPFILLALLSALAGTAAPAAEAELPPKDNEPILRIDPGAPSAFVTALAFSPDGKTLYAGGWDKVIRVWTRNNKGSFELGRTTYRVPVGPGLGGAINTLALSPEGNWLAAAGNGMARQIAGFRDMGFIVPAFGARDPLMLRDVGTIYLFHTRDQTVRLLRGHQGVVRSLTFGPRRNNGAPRLLSVAEDEENRNSNEVRLTARLWDVDKAESVGELKQLPAKALGGLLPGVALWQSGEAIENMQAAFALYDGNLRLWQPTNPREQTLPDLPRNLGVAPLGRDGLVTVGYNPERGQFQLTRWQVPAKGEVTRERSCNVGAILVRALVLLSRKGDSTSDLAAIVGVIPGANGKPPHQYRLKLVDLNGEAFGRIVADEPLWSGEGLQPVLAASLRGEHLAVAGNQGHDIRVYPLRALLGNEAVSPQILKSDALSFRHASFVRRGKDLGLLLNRRSRKEPGGTSPEPSKEQGDWVFDFGKRRLTDTLTGWEAARPKLGDWRARFDGTKTIAVHEGDKPVGEVVIPDKESLTDFALLPPGESVTVPLLAVATHKNGQPILSVYNAKSGEKLREFTGHLERVRSLAFVPDGRLLVSAANDGTVCVWSLIDLPTVLGRRGRLPGVSVSQAEEAVKVNEVKADSPAHGKLNPGDLLAGLVEKGELRRLPSPRAFYEALYGLKPGQRVILRRGDPKGKDDVTLVVGQGIDERKPLFSLFVSGAEKPTDGEWIGWSPIGPYESSSPKADKYLGWHFNTGEPRSPTRFASADQYRKIYYRDGILNRLIERGTFGRAEAMQLPPPVIGVMVEESGQRLPREGQAPILARRPRVDLKVTVMERPLSSLTALTWQLDGGKETPLELDRPDGASFSLPMTLSRGEHRFVITARTREAPLEPIHESLTVRYQPSAPEVALRDAGRQLFVRAADFTLQADIEPKAVGEEVRVTLNHRHDEGQEKPHTQTFTAQEIREGTALRFAHRLKLRPGNNVVEVVAQNGGARGDGKEETGRHSLEIFYIFKAKPPVIEFGRIVPLSGQGEGEALAVDASRPMVVRLPRVKLDGVIKAGEERLTEAVRDFGKGTRATRLRSFEPGKHAEITFQEQISLQRGIQTIRFLARTKNSDEAERSLTVDYRPPVPLVRLLAPSTGVVLDGEEETMAVPVRGKLVLPSSEARDYKAVLLVNGKPAAQSPVLDEKAGTLTGMALVGPGENRIQVQVSNPWGTVSHSEEVALRYVRPPVLRSLKHEPVPGRALVNLEAEVFSPTSLERKFVRVEINGQESSANEVQIEEGMKNLWSVRLQGVPLDAGSREQKIVLRVSNAEAECRRPAVLPVESAAVLPPPDADFLEPRHEASVSTPRVKVRFQVRSEGALERVLLVQDGRPDQPIDLSEVRREGGKYELTATREVELREGQNRLSVVAVSVSGRLPNSPQLFVTYTPPPLRVEIEHLTEDREVGPLVKPNGKDQETLLFPKVASGQVWLHGHISWADRGTGRGAPVLLRVFVNGFQQYPEPIRRKADETKTPFRVLLLLNRTRGNHVNLVASRQDAGGDTECTVDCDKPVTKQRLYVLALSARSQKDQLQQRILSAINSRRAEEGKPPSAFEQVKVEPLTGDRASARVLGTQLYWLMEEMRTNHQTTLKTGKPMNDVLMIYYEGEERIDEDGHFFEPHAGFGKADPHSINCDKLVDSLSKIPGAHVLLLDVERPAQAAEDVARDRIEFWKKSYPDEQSRVVVMRCARRGAPNLPGQVRLLPVLQQTIPQAGRLIKLVALVDKVLASSKDPGLLIFRSYVPTELADLMVSPAP